MGRFWAVAFEKFAERVEFPVADGEHEVVIGEGGDGIHGGREGFNHGGAGMNIYFWKGGDHGGGAAWRIVRGNRGRRKRLPTLFRRVSVESGV